MGYKDMEDSFKIGTICSTHGVHGEVKVFPTTDDPKRYKKLKKVFGFHNDEKIELQVAGVKFFKQFVIVKFEKFDSINDIEKYKGMDLFVYRKDAVSLEENEYYKADLLDMKAVSDDGNYEGIIEDILETGANDVYVIKLSDGRSVLLPAIKECIISVDIPNGLMTFHMMEGLL